MTPREVNWGNDSWMKILVVYEESSHMVKIAIEFLFHKLRWWWLWHDTTLHSASTPDEWTRDYLLIQWHGVGRLDIGRGWVSLLFHSSNKLHRRLFVWCSYRHRLDVGHYKVLNNNQVEIGRGIKVEDWSASQCILYLSYLSKQNQTSPWLTTEIQTEYKNWELNLAKNSKSYPKFTGD